MNGKGDRNRTNDFQAFRDSHDRVFGHKARGGEELRKRSGSCRPSSTHNPMPCCVKDSVRTFSSSSSSSAHSS